MKIFLTGVTGFIGRNIFEQLQDKYNIYAPTHKELDLNDDLKLSKILKDKNFDIIVHTAVKPGHRNASNLNDLVKINTRMFFNIVKNKDYFGKMLFLGSGSVYDKRYYKPKLKEEDFDKHIPIDDTGFMKYICSKYIEKSNNIIDLRVFGIFGKYEDYAIRFISNAICKSIFGLPITIKENKKFDYIFIDDFVKILEKFIENKVGYNAYNITPFKSIELIQLAYIVKEVSKNKHDIIIKRTGYGLEYSGDNTRLVSEFPDIYFTPFSEAIIKLYKWYYNNQNMIDREKLLFDK